VRLGSAALERDPAGRPASDVARDALSRTAGVPLLGMGAREKVEFVRTYRMGR
jgi:hypothetical protein